MLHDWRWRLMLGDWGLTLGDRIFRAARSMHDPWCRRKIHGSERCDTRASSQLLLVRNRVPSAGCKTNAGWTSTGGFAAGVLSRSGTMSSQVAECLAIRCLGVARRKSAARYDTYVWQKIVRQHDRTSGMGPMGWACSMVHPAEGCKVYMSHIQPQNYTYCLWYTCPN